MTDQKILKCLFLSWYHHLQFQGDQVVQVFKVVNEVQVVRVVRVVRGAQAV